MGKGGKFCHLKPMPQPDNYVCFMSVENPGQYIAFMGNGAPGVPRNMRENNQEAQFFIRIERHVSTYNTTIMTPFGRPSMANNFHEGSVIQLYLKENGNYISINRNGFIQYVKTPNDHHTFFRIGDRGMGIYTLHSYKYKGFRLRVRNNALEGKGNPDMSSDFRLKEMPDGTVIFESVVSGGVFVAIQGSHGLQTNLNAMLVTIQRFGGAETITKTPLN